MVGLLFTSTFCMGFGVSSDLHSPMASLRVAGVLTCTADKFGGHVKAFVGLKSIVLSKYYHSVKKTFYIITKGRHQVTTSAIQSEDLHFSRFDQIKKSYSDLLYLTTFLVC